MSIVMFNINYNTIKKRNTTDYKQRTLLYICFTKTIYFIEYYNQLNKY